MSQAARRTLFRFAAVGVANTAIDVGLFWVLYASIGIFLANFISTSAGMTFSFLVNGRHTFGATRLTVRQAVLFVATNGFTMWLLQPALMYVAHELVMAPLMPAKLVALAGSVVGNFLLYRYVVWPRVPVVTDVPVESAMAESNEPSVLSRLTPSVPSTL